ncbi:MAG TPA: class I SAM-dependent methyltransferase [Candidatus Eremiobacteraceae bacterium]|nr:class I SAM-dependent methyltransferase [Candidatus Eremiobacteraceae bacterium]
MSSSRLEKPHPRQRRPAAARRANVTPDLPLYREPELYDIAFGFRDVPQECDGILALARKHGVAQPESLLELACGPAHHLRELASRGLRGVGVDINPLMLHYARRLCRRDDVVVEFEQADMRTFALRQRVDMALCLFDSFALCVSDRDAIITLQRVHAALKRGGLFLIEFSHPADFFGSGRSRTMDHWTERNRQLSVKTEFRFSRFDAVAETFVADLKLQATDRKSGKRGRRVAMRWLQRMWFRSAVEYVTLASGCFDLVGWYGDLDPGVALTSGAKAWRMVAVLRRR